MKSPDGRRRARIVVCGNRVEGMNQPQPEDQEGEVPATESGNKSKTFDVYAAGIDGMAVRAALRTAGARGWTAAMTDIKTAFLLAPRRGVGKLIVRPPRVLVEAGIIPADEVWEVKQALYGLQTSPGDWSSFRDGRMRKWRWQFQDQTLKLKPTSEPNLWMVVNNSTEAVLGFVVVYVDDYMILGPKPIVSSVVQQIQKVWTCSAPTWLNETEAVKFCGFELKHKAVEKNLDKPVDTDNESYGPILVGQESYARELCSRHQVTKARPTPCSAAMFEKMPVERDERIDAAALRQAQGVTGEILWLAVRTRPDLAFAAGVMGRWASKCPRYAIALSKEILAYLYGTTSFNLEYGPVDADFMVGEVLPFQRSMTRVECFADISLLQLVAAPFKASSRFWEELLLLGSQIANPVWLCPQQKLR